MVAAKSIWWDFGKQALAALAGALILYCLGVAISNWYVVDSEAFRTPRTTGYFAFPSSMVYVLTLQSFFWFVTRMAWLGFPIFVFAFLMFQTFAWSGPNDQARIAESLQYFHIGLSICLMAINVLFCRVLDTLFPVRQRDAVPHQLKFDF